MTGYSSDVGMDYKHVADGQLPHHRAYFPPAKAPFCFPLDEAKWRVEYAAELEVTRGSEGALDVFATHSTAAKSEVNKEATTTIGISSGVSMRGSIG